VAQFEILRGPNENQLIDALRHRKHSHQLYFQVRPEDSRTPFRLYVYIDGLEYETDYEDIWRITAWPVRRGEKLVGLYCTRNRKGTLANDGTSSNPPIATLGFDSDVEERLYKAGIRTLADLIEEQEFNVCHMLLEDDLGIGVNNSVVSAAIERFERLRGRMDVLGHGFAGPRLARTNCTWRFRRLSPGERLFNEFEYPGLQHLLNWV
jgi:hypothetical protein